MAEILLRILLSLVVGMTKAGADFLVRIDFAFSTIFSTISVLLFSLSSELSFSR